MQQKPSVRLELSFLGPEFLTWLYFHIESCGGELKLRELVGDKAALQDALRIAVGKRVTLKSLHGGDSRITVAGSRLDDSGELLQAVRSGAYIDTLTLHLQITDRAYSLTLMADGSISQLRIYDDGRIKDDGHHEELQEESSFEGGEALDEEATFMMRMAALDEVEDIVDAFYKRFLARRLGQSFSSEDLRQIRAVVAENLAKKVPDLPRLSEQDRLSL